MLTRFSSEQMQILAFRHPSQGCQLVKGTIEPGEDHQLAALRELYEESGIHSASVRKHLGIWDSGFKGQIWSIYLCDAIDLENEWTHRTQDDGGQDFEFFWHPISSNPDEQWHPVYRRTIKWLRDRIQ